MGRLPHLTNSIASLFMLCLVLQGCSQGRFGKETRISLEKPVENLDPILSTDVATGTLLSLIHRRLYRATANGAIEFDLVAAEKIRGRYLFLQLKKVQFQDRSQLTANDVAFSLSRLKKSGRQSWILKHVEKVSALTRFTLKITLQQAGSRALTMQRALFSMPQCVIYSRQRFKSDGTFMPAGSYQLLENTDEQIILQSAKAPLRFLILPDETSRWFFFQKGLIDIYEASGIYRFLPYDKAKYQLSEIDRLTVLYAAIVPRLLSQGKSHLQDREFRHWLNKKLNRTALTEKVLLGAYRSADYPVPASLAKPPKPYFLWQNSLSFQKQFDESIVIYSPPDRERRLAAQSIAKVIEDAGLVAKVKVFDLATLIRFNNSRKPGIYIFKWVADYPHASNFLLPLFFSGNAGRGGNRAHLKSQRIDRLLKKDLARGRFTKIQRVIQEEAPWVFIGFARSRYFIRKDLLFKPPITYTAWSEDLFH